MYNALIKLQGDYGYCFSGVGIGSGTNNKIFCYVYWLSQFNMNHLF